LVRAADRVEHRKGGMIRVAIIYRLCSPPGLRRFLRNGAIPIRYVTENTACQQVANQMASTPSATPNDRLDIALAERPGNRHPRSVTVGRRTDAPDLSAGTTPWPCWSRCKPSMSPGMYVAWHDALPDSLRDAATAEAPQAIVDDLGALLAIVPPRGYGRD
jgi:hypothetical protein